MTALEAFALAVLAESRIDGGGDIDGGWLQDKAEALGLLVRVRVTRPCSPELCYCAEYYAADEWPAECLRYSTAVQARMK